MSQQETDPNESSAANAEDDFLNTGRLTLGQHELQEVLQYLAKEAGTGPDQRKSAKPNGFSLRIKKKKEVPPADKFATMRPMSTYIDPNEIAEKDTKKDKESKESKDKEKEKEKKSESTSKESKEKDKEKEKEKEKEAKEAKEREKKEKEERKQREKEEKERKEREEKEKKDKEKEKEKEIKKEKKEKEKQEKKEKASKKEKSTSNDTAPSESPVNAEPSRPLRVSLPSSPTTLTTSSDNLLNSSSERKRSDSDGPPNTPPVSTGLVLHVPPPVQSNLTKNLLPTNEDVQTELRQRNRILNEIVDTEGDYVNDLTTIIEEFIVPLRSENILNSENIQKIFSNVEMLKNVNEILYQEFLAAAKKNETNIISRIGDSFIRLADYLKMYSVYCSNQKVSMDTIDECSKKGNFKQFLEDKMNSPRCRGLTIQSYLIKPIQRVCKYPLLLRELMKFAAKDPVDHEKLSTAAMKIEQVVNTINEKKRVDENLQKLFEIQQLFQGGVEIVSPSRRWLMDGKLNELAPTKVKERHYFLFNNLLIRATKKRMGESFTCKTEIPLENLLVQEVDESLSVFENAFQIIHSGIGSKFVVYADSAEEKQRWMDNMNSIVKPYQEIVKKNLEEQKQQQAAQIQQRMQELKEAKKDPKRKGLPPPPPVKQSPPPGLSFSQQLQFQMQRTDGTPTTPPGARPIPPNPNKALTMRVTRRETVDSPGTSPPTSSDEPRGRSHSASYSRTPPTTFQSDEDGEEENSEESPRVAPQPPPPRRPLTMSPSSPNLNTSGEFSFVSQLRSSKEEKAREDKPETSPIVPAHKLPPRTQRSFQPPSAISQESLVSPLPSPPSQPPVQPPPAQPQVPPQPQPPILAPRKPTPPSQPPPRMSQPPSQPQPTPPPKASQPPTQPPPAQPPLQPQPPVQPPPRTSVPPSQPPPKSTQPPRPPVQAKPTSSDQDEPENEAPSKPVPARPPPKVEANESVIAAVAAKAKVVGQPVKITRTSAPSPVTVVRPTPPPKTTQPPSQPPTQSPPQPQLPTQPPPTQPTQASSQPSETPSANTTPTPPRPVRPSLPTSASTSSIIIRKKTTGFEPRPPQSPPPASPLTVQSSTQPSSQPPSQLPPKSTQPPTQPAAQPPPKTTQPPLKRVASFGAPPRPSPPKVPTIRLKCTYTDTRFVEIPEDTITLAELQSSIRKKFLRDSNQPDLLVRFKDPDGHIVTVVCDEDLQAAIQEFSITDLYLFDN